MGEITWGTATAILTAPFVFLLPGWALLSLLLPPEGFPQEPVHHPDAVLWLVLAAGLTLALTPVALLLLYLTGLKIGTGVVLGGLVLSAMIVVWRRRRLWSAWWCQARSWRERMAKLDAPLVALALVLALLVGVRLWVVRGINVGFWGDSYHHTMIAQLLLDNGGLFQSWKPYVPLRSFTYHFGFHGTVALFQWATGWLTGNPTPRTVVLVGQFLSALAVLALYPLAVRLSGGHRWAGVVAVLIAGLLTPMPMYYVNWGRYTQLAGQVVLPVALWLTMEAVEARHWEARRPAVATLAVAGLALTHYRVLVLYVAFLVPYLPYRLWVERKERPWREPVGRLAGIGCAALAMVLPWAWNLWRGYYPTIAAGFIQRKVSASWVAEYNAIGKLTDFVPLLLLILAALGALWSLRHRPLVILVAPWMGVVILVTNPHLVGLPGAGLMTNFFIALALYVPVSILGGYLVGEGLTWLARRGRLAGYAAVVAVLAVGVWGARARATVLDRSHQVVTPADEQAMTWIREHTPPDARFLTNAFFAYGGGLVAGSDAGWWIPLLTGRGNTMPPMLYGSEVSSVPGYLSRVNDFVRAVQSAPLDDPATLRLLRQQGVSHVYVGAKGGPLLSVEELQRSDAYRPVYHQDSIWIFEIEPGQE
mgnify:CR=1 FL=1